MLGLYDVQNFYPGEALLAIATLYEKTNNNKYLEILDKSSDYYMNWHI